MTASLSCIDISGDPAEVAPQLLDSLSQSGFAYVRTRGTGLAKNDVQSMFDLSKRFFVLDMKEKMPYRIGPENRGWSAMFSEILDPASQKHGDTKECFNIAEFTEGNAQQELPPVLDENLQALLHFSAQCRDVCLKLLDLLVIALEVTGEDAQRWLSRCHTTPSGSTLRMLWYPAYDGPGDKVAEFDLRAGAHTDYGSLTLLFQQDGQEGLEIQNADESWLPVAVRPPGTEADEFPPVVINIADLMSYWTHGLLRSAVHRVVSSSKTRYVDRHSMAYFCHPRNDTLLSPIPSQIVADHARNSPSKESSPEAPITAQQHLQKRLAATYKYET